MNGRKFLALTVLVFALGANAGYAADDVLAAPPAVGNQTPSVAGGVATLQVSGSATVSFIKIFNEEVWPLIQKNFVRELPNTEAAKEECLENILKAGLSLCLSDPHSRYIPKREVARDNEEMIGRFAGVGLELQLYNESISITAVVEDSPAALSGKFQPGDVLIEVDGESVVKMSLEQAVKKIRGLTGSTVTLRVSRLGTTLKPVTLTRAEIVTRSVKTEVIDDHTVLIKIYHFTADTYAQFLAAIEPYTTVDKANGQITKFNKNFVIDLRNNPGGLLSTVTAMGHLFAEKPADVLVVIRDRKEEKSILAGDFLPRMPFEPSQLGLLRGMHFVVLVNHHSASASEIFAGLIQDFKAAKIIGLNTFGKGSVQSLFQLPDGSELWLTNYEYFVGKGSDGKGVKVNGVGIKPDVKVNNPITLFADDDDDDAAKKPFMKPKLVDLKKDRQLRVALKILKKENQQRHEPPK